MKNLLFTLLFILTTSFVKSQIVQSSCAAHDSIISKYIDDADHLALQRIFRNDLSYTDSIEIPASYSIPVLDAMIAVYNAVTLSARDTVVSIYNIHAYPNPSIRIFYMYADSSQMWMQNLKNNLFPTGEPTVDSLMLKYDVEVIKYYAVPNIQHMVYMSTKNNYNIRSFVHLWQSVPGINYCLGEYYGGGGNDIYDSIYSDHIELIYSKGWGDCYSGCTERRYWKFNVYSDCSVEYVGSYGSNLSAMGILEIVKDGISISPNPFEEYISVNGSAYAFQYSIISSTGNLLRKGICSNNRIDKLDNLPPGVYLLKIQGNTKAKTFQIIKK